MNPRTERSLKYWRAVLAVLADVRLPCTQLYDFKFTACDPFRCSLTLLTLVRQLSKFGSAQGLTLGTLLTVIIRVQKQDSPQPCHSTTGSTNDVTSMMSLTSASGKLWSGLEVPIQRLLVNLIPLQYHPYKLYRSQNVSRRQSQEAERWASMWVEWPLQEYCANRYAQPASTACLVSLELRRHPSQRYQRLSYLQQKPRRWGVSRARPLA
jgi:hypothetical protein